MPMTESGRMRRAFLKLLPAVLTVPALWLMSSLTKRNGALPENAETLETVPIPQGNGVSFSDKLAVVTGAEGVGVFSSRCPHMGCRVNQVEGGELVCPCHGSRFDRQGKLVRGPAGRGLQPLSFEVDRAASVLRVKMVGEEVGLR